MQQSQNLQQQIGQEKANLIGQAQTATDPLSVGQQATAVASGFSTPSSFQPLGSLFGNFANLYLGQQLANTYNPAYLSMINNYQQNSLPGLGGGGSGYLPSTAFGG